MNPEPVRLRLGEMPDCVPCGDACSVASGAADVTPAYRAAVPLEEFIAISEGGMRAFFEAIDFVLLPVDTGTTRLLG